MIFKKSSRYILALIFLSAGACTMKGNIEDISEAELAFVTPSAKAYTNDTGYKFKVQMDSNVRGLAPESATLEVYEGSDCDPAKKISSRNLNSEGATAYANASSALEDGKTYSARVFISNKEKTFQSKCSPPVGVDLQNPNPVSVNYPAGNGYVSSKEIVASWTTATDNGISGLSEVPYRLRLYGQPACGGSVLQTVDSAVEQYKFKKLTQGVSYTVQVSSVDKAGNESVLACSPYQQVDIYAPGFTLRDPTSSEGYSRVTSPQVLISNDSQAAYWCFTKNLTFVPTSYTDVCPAGSGSASGWYTSRPSTLPIGSGDGLKIFNLWIVRADGSLISANVASGAITLDQTPPGNFTVVGVGGVTDTHFDAYFTSVGQPEVKWNASSDAVDYTVDIRTTSNTLVCSMSQVTSASIAFEGCPTLVNGTTYRARVTAFDVARNQTQASDFDFVVDRDPPGAFTISGITGAGDTNVDNFTGTGNPTVNYTSASASHHYRVHIDDASGANVCSVGMKVGQSGTFDYAAESGVVCAGLVHGGVYKAFVSAFDDGENETAASNNGFSFQVDTVNPTLTLDTVPASPTSNTFATFNFTTGDDLSGVFATQCQLDGGAYNSCTSPKSLTGLAEGSHTMNVRVYDRAGNSKLLSHTWIVDLTNPILTIDSQPAPYTAVATNAIAFHATDASGIASITCSVDGASPSSCASPLSTTLTNGPHSVVIRATDNVGFYDEKTVNFVVDTINPALSLTSIPANPSHNTSTASVSFNVSDTNLSTVQCKLDSGSYANCTSPVNYSGLASGTHTITVQAKDLAGNTSTQSTTWIIYNYVWTSPAFAGCTASQPSWSIGGWYGCTAPQPSFTYDGWGGCSATCGGGWQYRSQYCSASGGTEYRAVSCPTSTGTEYRTPQCQRSDSVIVADTYCNAGTKPTTSQACSRSDCPGGTPAGSQACSRSDCTNAQATSQQCNTQSCKTWHNTSNMAPGTYSSGGSCGYYPPLGGACSYATPTTMCFDPGGMDAWSCQ